MPKTLVGERIGIPGTNEISEVVSETHIDRPIDESKKQIREHGRKGKTPPRVRYVVVRVR